MYSGVVILCNYKKLDIKHELNWLSMQYFSQLIATCIKCSSSIAAQI